MRFASVHLGLLIPFAVGLTATSCGGTNNTAIEDAGSDGSAGSDSGSADGSVNDTAPPADSPPSDGTRPDSATRDSGDDGGAHDSGDSGTPTDSGFDAGNDSASCLPDGLACMTNAQCCGGDCNGGICHAVTACSRDGESCATVRCCDPRATCYPLSKVCTVTMCLTGSAPCNGAIPCCFPQNCDLAAMECRLCAVLGAQCFLDVPCCDPALTCDPNTGTCH